MELTASPVIIGVDGGGTGCRAAIGTVADGMIARAQGGRANLTSDPVTTFENIIATVALAAKNAGISTSALKNAVAHIGVAGVVTAQDIQRMRLGMPYKTTTVTDDRPTALIGALGGQYGHLLSVGTGTIAAVNAAHGMAFVGSWGFQVSDHGSGAWLGRAALEQVLLCHDRMAQHTDLTRDIFATFNNDPRAIVSLCATAKPGDYAALAPVIVAQAKTGDLWGQRIMHAGAQHLTNMLGALDFRVGQPLCLTGGIGPHYAPYLPARYLDGYQDARGSALDGAFELAILQHTAQTK